MSLFERITCNSQTSKMAAFLRPLRRDLKRRLAINAHRLGRDELVDLDGSPQLTRANINRKQVGIQPDGSLTHSSIQNC